MTLNVNLDETECPDWPLACTEKLIEGQPLDLSSGQRGFESSHSTVTCVHAPCILQLKVLACVGQCDFMNFKRKVVQAQILACTTRSYWVGLEEKCLVHLIGQLQAYRSDVGPNIHQRATVEMKADKRNVPVVRNTPVYKPSRHDAVRIGNKTKAIEEVDYDRGTDRPFPQLPSNKMKKSPQALISIRFVPPDRAHNKVQVTKEHHISGVVEAAQRCASSYTFQFLSSLLRHTGLWNLPQRAAWRPLPYGLPFWPDRAGHPVAQRECEHPENHGHNSSPRRAASPQRRHSPGRPFCATSAPDKKRRPARNGRSLSIQISLREANPFCEVLSVHPDRPTCQSCPTVYSETLYSETFSNAGVAGISAA